MNPDDCKNTKTLVMDTLGLPDRSWSVLRHRLGPSSKKTLKEVGEIFELTRERIRQIQAAASKKISSRIDLICGVLETLEAVTPRDTYPHDERGVEKAYAWFEQELRSVGISFTTNDIQRLIVAIRAAPNKCGVKWPQLTVLTCFLYPRVRGYSPVDKKWRELEAARKEKERQWSYPELIEYVLDEESKPLHWREVVQKARAIGRRRSVHPGSVMNTMIASDDFVRVAPGTYALKRLGYEEVDPLVDRIWTSIINIGGPASLGEIVHELKKGDHFRANSVKMHLDLHPRFYTSVNGRYGLRILLPAPNEQTLRTPSEKVEASDSLKRVARALKNGYSVDDVLEADRESFEALKELSENDE